VSRDRTNGRLESQHVTALTPSHKDSLVEMRVEGERTPLRPSLDHPFWVKRGDAVDGSWMEAGNMRVGDLLQTIQGNWRRVVSITPVEGQETVYNFTVANDHDYFVGQTGFLVHNESCEPCGAGGDGEQGALGEALRRHGADPGSPIERIPVWGGTPAMRGPQGQPYEIIQALNEAGDLIEFHHHCWGHNFPDGKYEPPHYHGPDGEHIFY
jgi:hypothetical protein